MRVKADKLDSNHEDRVPLLENANKTKNPECAYFNKDYSIKDKHARNKLILACIICLLFVIGEIIGGIISNSLAILTDSAHLFSDLSSFLISLAAMFLSGKPSSKTMTFGWHRAEVLGAFFSVLLIWVVTGVLIYTAILRLVTQDFIINSKVMLIMSVIAVFVNVIMAFVLHPHSHTHDNSHSHEESHDHSHGHSHGLSHDHSHGLSHEDSHDHSAINIDSSLDSYEQLSSSVPNSNDHNCVKQRGMKQKVQNINLRAAFIHVVGDIVQSIGVLIASIIIYFKPQWKIADPICTFIFALLVLFTTVSIFFDIMCILLERKPRHLNYQTIEYSIANIPGVSYVHNLRLWSITLNITAASCHLVILDKDYAKAVLDRIYQILAHDFYISEIAIQLEPLNQRSDIIES